MTDRRGHFEGRQPTSRHRSPSPDDPQYRYESLNHASGAYPGGSSRTRPRLSRSGSSSNSTPHTASPSYGEGDRGGVTRSKATRNTLKKAPRRDSLHNDTPSGSQSGQYYEEDTVGYFPKLNQIREGKKSRQSRSSTSSTVSSTVQSRTRRSLKIADHAIDRSRVQHHEHMLQQRADSPAKMATASEVSVPSEVTQESNISNESGTTVTQTTHDDQSDVSDSESEPETYISDHSEAPKELTPAEMEAAQTNVFQYMHQAPTVEEFTDEEETHGQPLSSASSSAESSDESDHEDTQSSNTGSPQFLRDTPTTSPASMRMSNSGSVQREPRKYRNTKKPLYASSFVHGHGGRDDEEEPEESEEASDDESNEGEEGDVTHNVNDGQRPGFALEKVQPPRVPSTSSRHSDPHSRRLRQQEQDLANHLQSPQPQKDFQFAGGPSPHPQPTMPLYSPRAYSGASPANFEPTAGYPADWPQFPPPLPIGYPTQAALESPTGGHPLPLTVQPPMSAPSLAAQQHAPPFHPYPGQPPQYQAHVPAPDVTKTTAAGYELLANKLSETPKKSSLVRKGGNVVPMYRKFEHLNHRVLLHLQDEVCEMEEELRYLDESIIQTSPRDDAGHAFPASRRGDARYGNELHYKRTELLGRIFQKLGQYNQALTSFNGLVKELDPASTEDIQAYRAWMEKRAPIDFAETRFLERKHDLLAVSRRTSETAGRGAQHLSAAIWLPLVLVLPFLAFAIVPSLLGRLIVIALMGAAGLRQVTSTPELMGYLTVQEWCIGSSVYFGLMALLAGVVR